MVTSDPAENSESTEGQPESPARSGRPQSTIRFPYYDLDDSTNIVRAISNNTAGEIQIDQLARLLDHKSVESGAFRLRLSAAAMYGLVEPRDGTVVLTDRARAFLSMHPEDSQAALAQAFLAVPLFRRVYDNYQGRQLPPEIGLKNVIRDLGVVPNQVDRALSVLERSAERAGFFASGRGYLVEPLARGRAPATTEPIPEEPEARRESNGGPPSPPPPTGIHPALMGLLQLLPPFGTYWGPGRKREWMAAFSATVNAIYPDVTESEEPMS